MDIPEINLQNGSRIVASAGALNLGLAEGLNTTLIPDLVGTGNEGLVLLGIGVAGGAALADQLELVDLGDMA